MPRPDEGAAKRSADESARSDDRDTHAPSLPTIAWRQPDAEVDPFDRPGLIRSGPVWSGRIRGAEASDTGPRLGEHGAQDLFDVVELGLADDEGRGELDHGVAAVVGAADEAGVVEGA